MPLSSLCPLFSCFFARMVPTCFGLHLDQGTCFLSFLSPASRGLCSSCVIGLIFHHQQQ